MPKPEFFQNHGLFIERQFLDPDLCRRICAEMQQANNTPATVTRPAEAPPEETRKTKLCWVSKEISQRLTDKLFEIQPRLEAHFNIQFQCLEKPQFLLYGAGDFFSAHIDRSDGDHVDDLIRQRQISVVIFLNQPTDDEADPDGYGGGALQFFNLIKTFPWNNCGFPLEAEAGLLVAFSSDQWHAVTPVTFGYRCSLVSWFFSVPVIEGFEFVLASCPPSQKASNPENDLQLSLDHL